MPGAGAMGSGATGLGGAQSDLGRLRFGRFADRAGRLFEPRRTQKKTLQPGNAQLKTFSFLTDMVFAPCLGQKH
jgi:hypothetical protein